MKPLAQQTGMAPDDAERLEAKVRDAFGAKAKLWADATSVMVVGGNVRSGSVHEPLTGRDYFETIDAIVKARQARAEPEPEPTPEAVFAEPPHKKLLADLIAEDIAKLGVADEPAKPKRKLGRSKSK